MLKEVLGRVLTALLLVPALHFYPNRAFANRISVFDVRKSLPMTAQENAYHDYYINAGTEVGLKPGAIVTVTRYVPLHDPMQNRSQGDLAVPVAKLQVIHAQNNLAVARFHSAFDRKSLPVLEYEGVMAGDRVEVNRAEYNEGKRKPNSVGAAKPVVKAAQKKKPRAKLVGVAAPSPAAAAAAKATPMQSSPSAPMGDAAPQASPSQEIPNREKL